jgi:multimeric flavodoxin WrbA
MTSDLSRRRFLEVAGTAGAAGAIAGAASAQEEQAGRSPIKIVGVCCSPRPGMSTAQALQVSLDAARQVDPETVEIELIELAGLRIPGEPAAGVELAAGEQDDFPSLVPKLADPKVAGMIIGTPVYFSNMTALCKAFLDRLIFFRKNDFALADKVAGVIAVGGARNGGQLLAVETVQAALYCQDMIVVGAGRPTTRCGAAVWNQKDREITDDEAGMQAARDVGRRVAEVALRMAGA